MRTTPDIVIHLVGGHTLTVPITPASRRKWKLMEEDSITLSFNLAENEDDGGDPLAFGIGDYVIDELFGKFVITDEPLPADYDVPTGALKYTLRFDREYIGWKNKVFQLSYASNSLRETNWTLTDKLSVHLDEVIKNLAGLGYRHTQGGNEVCNYYYVIHDSVETKDSYCFIKYDGADILSALNEMAKVYRCEWWVTESWVTDHVEGIIHFGKCEVGNPIDFIYKDANPLNVNTEKVTPSRDSDEYVNRIYAFGSTKNIPDTYRKNLNFTVDQNVSSHFQDSLRKITPYMVEGEKPDDLTLTIPDTYSIEEWDRSDAPNLPTKVAFGVQFTLSKPVRYEISVPAIMSSFIVGWYGTAGYPGALYCNYKLRLYVDGTPIGDEVGGTVATSPTAETISQDRREKHESKSYGSQTATVSLTAGTHVLKFCLSVHKAAHPDMEPFRIGIDSPTGISSVDAKAACRSFYADTKIIVGGTDYPIRINPDVVEAEEADYTRFVFTGAVPTGFGVGTHYFMDEDDFVFGSVPSSYYTDDLGNPSNLRQIGEKRLMLPVDSRTPHGYYPDTATPPDELVEKVVVFDEIYPRCALRIDGVPRQTEGNITTETYADESKAKFKFVAFSVKPKRITPSGDVAFPFMANYAIETLQIKFLTPDEENKYTRSNTPRGDTTNGYRLAGMTFDVNWSDTTKEFTIVWNDTYGAKLPNLNLAPYDGDPFILTGWNVKAMKSLGLIEAAEDELYDAVLGYYDALQNDQFTFDCKMMSDWARVQGVLPYGQKARIYHDSLASPKVSRVIGYELKLDIPEDSPTYTVGETEAYSRLRNLEKSIGEIQSGGSVSGTETTAYVGGGGVPQGVGLEVSFGDETEHSILLNVGDESRNLVKDSILPRLTQIWEQMSSIGSLFNNGVLSYAAVPSLYVGTTPAQSQSVPQALSGITTGSFSGDVAIGGALGVTGASTLSSLGVTGNAAIGGTLGAAGLSSLNGGLSVTGASSLNGTLGVSGLSSLNGGIVLGSSANALAARLEWSEANNAWHLIGNFYADGWIASGGVGTGGGGGGGTDLNRVWESLTNNTDFPNEKINLAHIPDLPYTQVTGLDSWVAGKGYALASSVPTALSQLTDDSTHRLVTDAQIAEWTNKAGNVQADWNATTGLAVILNKPSLSAVATSGSYNDLTNRPTIPAAQVNADWNAVSGVAQILNKPSSLPASDVYSWAKAASKPSYSLDEISGTTDLQLIEALTGNGLLRRNNNAWSLDSANYITENQTITLTGDVTGSGKTSIATTIGNGKVTNAMLAGSIENSKLNTIGVTKGGTGLTSISKGAILYASTSNTISALSANGTGTKKFLSQTNDNAPSWSALAASDIPSLNASKITEGTLDSARLPSMYIGKTAVKFNNTINDTLIGINGFTTASSASANNDTSKVVWDEQNGAWHFIGNIYADGWIASGGIGSGSSGGGSMVTWGTKSGYTRPLTVEGVTETLLLEGALAGYATTSAMNTALAGKQDSLAFTLQGASGATYNLANALYGAVLSNGADIGTSLTTIATVAGVEIKAKITHQSLSDYATQSWVEQHFALVGGDPDYDFEVGSLIIGDGALTIGNDYRPVWQYPGTDPSTFPPTPITVSKSLAYLDEVVLLSGSQTISGTKSFRGSINGGTSLQTKWSITNAGVASFASLTVDGKSVLTEHQSLANYVTLDGTQTITGAKTFSAQMTASGGIVTGNDILPASNLGASLGNGQNRFSGLSVDTISSSAYYFRNSSWAAIAHYSGGFDDGIGYLSIYLDTEPNNPNPPQNSPFYYFGSGSFLGSGGTKNLGSNNVPWGDIYIANNKAIRSKDTNGNAQDILKFANNDWLYIGNNGITSVQLNATGYIKMYWDSGDAFASFGAGANAYFPNLLPNGTSGTKNLGSSSERWNNIYASGNLSLSQTSHIDIGPVRLEYANEALHITTNDATNHPNIGAYADGFVASGGIGSGNASVKYVTCTQVEYNAMTKDPATLYLIGSPISKICLGSITLYSET